MLPAYHQRSASVSREATAAPFSIFTNSGEYWIVGVPGFQVRDLRHQPRYASYEALVAAGTSVPRDRQRRWHSPEAARVIVNTVHREANERGIKSVKRLDTTDCSAIPNSGHEFSSASSLISVLEKRTPKLALALATGQAAWPASKRVRDAIKGGRTYTVKVPGSRSGDELYDELHEWVLSLLTSGQRRALVAYASGSGNGNPRLHDVSEFRRTNDKNRLRLRYDGSREQQITVRSFKVKVGVSDGNPDAKNWQPPEIIFVAATPEARDAIVAEISVILEKSQNRKRAPVFRMLNNWDEWERVDDLPPRSLESVILPEEQSTRIENDISGFLAGEEIYARRSVPWHRGYLYEGPPGTGKTSLARALACHYGLDMWYLSLTGIKNDTSLIKTVMGVKSRSILLIEDIDVFHTATQRGDEFGGSTLSGLLNALDGIATPHGLITILTTNKPEVLDPALVRPGRIDAIEHFGLSGQSEIARLIAYWYSMDPDEVKLLLPEDFRIAPADVTQICSRHDDPGDATHEIISMAEANSTGPVITGSAVS